MSRYRGLYSPLLGTSVEVVVDAGLTRSARRIAHRLVEELRRLEAVFNVYSPTSELCRLIDTVDCELGGEGRGPGSVTVGTSQDLGAVLALAVAWYEASRGRFDPMIGSAVDTWRVGRETDEVPSADTLKLLARANSNLPFAVVDGELTAKAALTGLNLNALAKGWILDRAVQRCATVGSIMVNAGGDICRWGGGSHNVQIEDPARPYDNAEPLTTIRLTNGAVATSGSSRRPIEIAGHRFNHIVDPSTAHPAAEVAAASVVASEAATADVLATILAAAPLAEAQALVGSDLVAGHGAAALVVGVDGSTTANGRWSDLEVTR